MPTYDDSQLKKALNSERASQAVRLLRQIMVDLPGTPLAPLPGLRGDDRTLDLLTVVQRIEKLAMVLDPRWPEET